ncbi:Flp pilus assembly protein CpaB [Bacillus marinisedimentorum]|uniref:Flp pilus assembly protein CpaB n=1 Tax=Bacillus marinisedimentorum TaxID=1821260 RepID=UPI000871C237|nr:Flp pilus assembly protein CpaB [Bacillus marinisedimentorum]
MRSKFTLFAAILMGIITTFLFYQYMERFDAAAAADEKTVQVVAVKEPVGKNTALFENMLKKVDVPQQAVHPNAVLSMEDAAGKVTTARLETDEIVLSHHLQETEDESLIVSRKVTAGKRAVSIGVNLVQSVSNLIEPEDDVDVIFSEVKKEGEEEKVISKLLLSKKRVLAVGRKMVETKEGDEYAEYTSVTLELAADEAVKLVNASERGPIHITLHSRVTDKGGENDGGGTEANE